MNRQCVYLPLRELPTEWYNVKADLPVSLPPVLDPDDGSPSRIALMERIRPRALTQQEQSDERWWAIPQDVLTKLVKLGRPTPLQRALALESYLDTPARIYVKREDMLPTGSFKLNTSVTQAYYAHQEGLKGLVSETGAGQWGSALALSCTLYGMKAIIYMARASYDQKPYRRFLTQLLGGTVYPSPSERTEAGRSLLRDNPNHAGSIGTGISEAIETAANDSGLGYASGSNLAHVLMHQSIIGLETKRQLAMIGESPDALVACVGGGSNLGGFMFPFLPDKLDRGEDLYLLGAESTAAPRLTQGAYRYDHGDPVGLTPLTKSYTLGMEYIPPPVHVGGLRQHSGSPLIGVLRHEGLLAARAYTQEEALRAGQIYLQLDGVVPAPESCHAIVAAMELAREAKEAKEAKVIVFCMSGHGLLELNSYEEVVLGGEEE